MIHDGDGLTGADTRSRAAIDFRRGVHVVMVDYRRTAVIAHLDQGPERDAVAFAIPNFQIADVLDLHAVLGRGLEVNLPVAILKEEVIHIDRTQVSLQGGIDILKLNLLSLGFLFIDIDKELRLRDAEAAEEAC